jgi:hypothetical protein
VSDLLPIGCLVVVGDQAYHLPSANLVLESCLAMQAWVNREYSRGLSTLLGSSIVEDLCGRCVATYPYHASFVRLHYPTVS